MTQVYRVLGFMRLTQAQTLVWAGSPGCLALLEVGQQAFDLILFGIEPA